jgi:drug/metabolite transporter (DMT)-like permease
MPDWLLGVGLMVCGQVLGAIALGYGEISLVEPLTATNLLFAMALSRRLSGQPLGWNGWLGVALLALGVTAFIVAGRPRGGGAEAGALRHWLVFGTVAGIALLLTLKARRLPRSGEAALLGLAAGLLYGLQDSLTRVCGQIVQDQGIGQLLVSWQPYAVGGLGLTGMLLVQSAFEMAPLRMSLPSLTAAQPIAGIVCGVGFLGDRLRVTTGALAWEAAGLAAIVVGVVLLGRHPAMPAGSAEREPVGATRLR